MMKRYSLLGCKVLHAEQSEGVKPEPTLITENRSVCKTAATQSRNPQQKNRICGTVRHFAVSALENVRCLFVPRREDAMNVFEAVKQELDHPTGGRDVRHSGQPSGMAVCPFHK